MSIALPVHFSGPTFTPGSTIAGHLVSKRAVHLLHNKHRTLSLYEADKPGATKKIQEFLTTGATSIHLIAAQDKECLDEFVMVGDLVDWYSIQAKGIDAIHDFVRLESQEQLMRFCRTVPYTFAHLDPDSQELVETRRFYFAEDRSPTILTHSLPDGTSICIVGTSNGLIGALNAKSDQYDGYYKVRGCENTTYRYASLSKEHIVVQVSLNEECCFYFLSLNPSGALNLIGIYEPKQMPLGVGPVPANESSVACIWFENSVQFVDPICCDSPKCLQTRKLPLSLESVRHAPQLSEPGVEAFLTASYLIRVRGIGTFEIVETPMTGAQISGGNLYFNESDLLQLRKFNDSSSPGWAVCSTGHASRHEFPFTYEFVTISSRGCESLKKEFSSWCHYFDPNLGSSFLTTKDASTYAVCRKSGLCADKIDEIIQLWLYKNDIIATTDTETMVFSYEGTPRLELKPRPLFSAMDSARTYAFKNGTQVTGTRIISINTGKYSIIPSRCMPISDATCLDESNVVVASDFSIFAFLNGNIVAEKSFEEPVIKVIADGGIIAIMTLQQLHIEYENHSKTIHLNDRLSDVVITNGYVISATFDGSLYLGSEKLAKMSVNCVPIKLVVAGRKVLAVTEVDAMIIDTLTLSARSALPLEGVKGGFAWDNTYFAVLKNGNMWVCDLNSIGLSLQKTSQMFIGPIKADKKSAPQWTWCEKLACTNAINSVRFGHEITDVCPIHPLQQQYLQEFDGLITAIEPKAYISSFDTLYLWADFKDFDLFKRLTCVQKRLETRDHTIGGYDQPKLLEWRGFVDGALLDVALQNRNVDWLFEEEGVNAEELRRTFQLVSY